MNNLITIVACIIGLVVITTLIAQKSAPEEFDTITCNGQLLQSSIPIVNKDGGWVLKEYRSGVRIKISNAAVCILTNTKDVM